MKKRLLLLVTLQLLLIMLISSCTTTPPAMTAGPRLKDRVFPVYEPTYHQDSPKRNKSNMRFKPEPDNVAIFFSKLFSF